MSYTPNYKVMAIRTGRNWISYLTLEYKDIYTDFIPVSIGRTRAKFLSMYLTDDIYSAVNVAYCFVPLSELSTEQIEIARTLIEQNKAEYQKYKAAQ